MSARLIQLRACGPLSASLRVCALLMLAIVGAGIGGLATARATSAAPATHHATQLATTVRHAHGASASGHVTVIVLDMSGSMATNDPNGIRCSAADAYIDLSGPGDYIGVIGLDNSNGARGGPHNFELSQVWATPTEVAIPAQHTALENAIASKSNSCAPDNSTPTYDALNQSLTMLHNATQNGQIPGSVILLTDGVPAPDNDHNQQVAAIEAELVPQFQKNAWPIDTIALGQGQDFSFLSDIANATSGRFYDDTQGDASSNGSGSPLNIAPFFVHIFEERNHRTPGPTVAATTINNGETERDFQVGDYVDHLDVVAIKDNASTQITLTAPDGVQITPTTAGASYAADRYHHYVIYSIDGPQKGDWTFTISGSGSFLMDSLITSALGVNILSPTNNAPAQALGQDFSVSAQIVDHAQGGDTQINSPDFRANAVITYAGELPYGVTPPTQSIVLSNNAGTYQGTLNVPQSAPPGSYLLTVSVSQATITTITSDSRSLRLELFPLPCIGACGTAPHPAAVQWDPITQVVYSLPVLDWLSQWPLAGLPAHTVARLDGHLYLKGAVYPDANIASVSATRTDSAGKTISTPVTSANDSNGAFHLLLPYTGPGVYTLTIHSAGSFGQTHGDLGKTTIQTRLNVVPATIGQESRDAGFSLVYLFLAILIILLIRMAILPKPFGELQLADGAGSFEEPTGDEFANVRRNMWNKLVHPNKIWAAEMGMASGLVFIFDRSHIYAQSARYLLDSKPMSGDATEVDGRTIQEPGTGGASYKVLGKADIAGSASADPFGSSMDTTSSFAWEEAEATERRPGGFAGFLQGLGTWRPFGRASSRQKDANNAEPDDPFADWPS